MDIHIVEKNKLTQPLYVFFENISENLCIKIYNKFQSYVQHGGIYHGKHLKTLNSKIWKYKGTIYKLRVDSGTESARILFSKSNDGIIRIIHAFLKSTRKTPTRDAQQAIAIYQTLDSIDTIKWDEQSMLLCRKK